MVETIRRNWDSDNDGQIDASSVEAGAGSPLTTKGDLETYDTSPTRLPVGTDGQVLTANSATGTGLEWTAAGTTGIETQDEGVQIDPAATTLNFVGAGVTATDAGSNVTTVSIPGGGGGLTDFTSLYLPCDEADGIAEPVDESDAGLTITRTGTGFAHSNLQAISGTTSLRANNINGNEYYSVSTSSGYRFESEDFTVECWVRWATAPNATNFSPVFFTLRDLSTIDLQINFFNGNFTIIINSGAFSFAFPFTPSINTWYHVAFTKEGTDCRCFVDGTQIGITETGPATIDNNGFNLRFGGDGFNTIVFNGFIDEIRVLKGKALYTSNFTAPTPPLGLYTEGAASPLTTKGDLYTYDTADQRLPIGTDGQILSANSATSTGLEWINNIGGGGSTVFTREILGEVEVTASGTSEIVFDTINQTYKNLYLELKARTTSVSTGLQTLFLEVNDDTTNGNYDREHHYSLNGTSTSFSDKGTSNNARGLAYANRNGSPSGEYASSIIYIPDYTDIDHHKKFLGRSSVIYDTSNHLQGNRTIVWKNTSAITKIRLEGVALEDFANGTKFTLYGEKEVTVSGGGGSAIEVEDEGVSLTTGVTKFNFVGVGVTVTEPVTDEVLVTIPGGGGGSAVEKQAQVSLSTNQTFTSGANGFISWDTENNDPDGYYDVGNPTRLTIPTASDGEHLFMFNVRFAPNATGTRSFRLYKNGSLFRRQDFPASGTGFSTACMFTAMDPNAVATDFYEVNVLQDSGGNLDIIGETNAVFEVYKFRS